MVNLPKSCYVGRFIPKKKFYENMSISSGVKDDFVNKLEKITWLYKLSSDTTSISKTDEVSEIQIFEIELKEKCLPSTIIKTITKGIPYKILFKITYKDDVCYAVKLEDIYYTEWNEDVDLDLNVLNLEILFENIVKAVIKEQNNKNSFDEIIENKTRIDELNKEINKLRTKLKSEHQFDRKVELNNKLNELLKELELINNE